MRGATVNVSNDVIKHAANYTIMGNLDNHSLQN
jgi:hypothetical protein